VLSQCVWPYESGEVIVQNYNTLLTLATLLDAADGIIVVQNEALHAAANKLLNVARHGCAPARCSRGCLLVADAPCAATPGPRSMI
jgi:hypothetical protein